MKNILLACFLLFVSYINAQGPDSLWTRSFGGAADEVAGTNSPNSFGNNMASAAFDAVDGTMYLASYSASPVVYGKNNAGSDDVLLIHLDQNGDTLWTKLIGGTGSDRLSRVRSISTGGVILVGFTTSSAGVFAGNHGGYDGFMMRINSDGTILWTKVYGGSSNDYLYDVVENPAGNFVACGEAVSSDGDLSAAGNGLAWVLFATGVSGNMGFCVAPVGPNGASANGLENFTVIRRLNDGSGYLLSGFTSPDFNNFNLDDIWVCKINFTGAVLWNKTYGSTNGRDGSGALLDMGSGEFMIVGVLGGNDGYPTYRGGNGDGFVIRCNAAGDTLWTRSYGGTDWDFFHDAVADQELNVYLAGFSRSSNQQLTGQPVYGLADYWLVKINANGDTLYTKRMGGSEFDAATGIACSGLEDDILLTGRSNSNNGWIHGANGGRDMWAVRLQNIVTQFEAKESSALYPYPNPFNHELIVNTPFANTQITIRDIAGKTVFEQRVFSIGTHCIKPPLNLNSGIFFLETSNDQEKKIYRIYKD